MAQRILCVDDDPNILSAYQRKLRKRYRIDTALGGEEALRAISERGPYAVVVADMKMPGMNGVELLRKVQGISPDTVRMMLTGNADQQTAVDAVNEGQIFRFLNKPCPTELFARSLDAGLEQHRLITAEREVLEGTLRGAVRVLTEILGAVDPESFGRAERLKKRVADLARTLDVKSTWEVEIAAMLSRIGLVTVPSEVLAKKRAGRGLTGEEHRMLERVPEIGHRLLANIPRLETVARIVRYEDKRFDGGGIPEDDVRGEAIPLGARVLRLASDLVEMEAHGTSVADALGILKEREGWYDPALFERAEAVLLGRAGAAAAPATRTIRELSDLHPGMLLLSNVESHGGQLLVPSGTTVTFAVLERLRNWSRVRGIRIPIHVETP